MDGLAGKGRDLASVYKLNESYFGLSKMVGAPVRLERPVRTLCIKEIFEKWYFSSF